MLERLQFLAQEVAEDMVRLQTAAKTVTVKLKYFDFTLQTRSKTLLNYLNSSDALFTVARDLIRTPALPLYPVRLLGISVSNLLSAHDQPTARQLTFDF